jgi:hypothetical protein
MIPVGTPCWIIFAAEAMREYVGRQCSVTRHGFYGDTPLGTYNCMIRVKGEAFDMPAGFKCLVPIAPPPQKRRKEPKREKVFA